MEISKCLRVVFFCFLPGYAYAADKMPGGVQTGKQIPARLFWRTRRE